MYSQSKILARLDAISRQTGWLPEYHSISEVDEFNSHIEALTESTPKGKFLKRELNYDELKWIDNEFSICASDYRYWSTRYAYIKDSENNIRRFERRKSQEMLLSLWAEREEQNLSIEQQILKARQQGISSEVELSVNHRITFGRGVNAAVASSQDEQSERMNGMLSLAFKSQPFWMKPTPTIDRKGALLELGGIDCRLSMYSGRGATGIARGDTPTVVHLSEVCDWPNAKQLIEDSLFQAVHPSPKVFMIFESTGNGNTGWWADTWYYSKENFPNSRLQPVFFPWFLADDLFPTPTWELAHPIPERWIPLDVTVRMAEKCAAYVSSTPLMLKLMSKGWRLPRRQMHFWEQNYLERKAKGNEKGWYQEMPVDDIEALQPKKDFVFDLHTVEEQFQHRVPYTTWAITGEQILEKHSPLESDIDYDDLTRRRFRMEYPGREKRLVWEFVPLKIEPIKGGKFFNADRKLLVFHPPEPGYDYGIGVDTAQAASGDNFVVSVIRKSKSGLEPDVHAAIFASNQVSSAEGHAFVMAIASWYGFFMRNSPGEQEPLVAVEQVRGPGDNVQLQMQLLGYKRLYHFSRIDGKNPKKDKKKSKRLGWYTVEWSRQFMLDRFKHAFENGWLILNCPFLLRNEMGSYVIDRTPGGRARYDHESGKHDDRIFATAIAFIILNDTEPMGKKIESRFVPAPERLPQLILAPIDGFKVSYEQVMGAR